MFFEHNRTQMQKSRSSADPLYTHDHEPPLIGFRAHAYRVTPPPEPVRQTPEEFLKLLGESLIPFGFRWEKVWGERKTNNLLIDIKTEPNPNIYYTKDIINLLDEQFKPAIKKSIEYASKKMRENNLKEVDLTGAGEGFTLVKLGIGGHGGGHTFRRAKQTNKDI